MLTSAEQPGFHIETQNVSFLTLLFEQALLGGTSVRVALQLRTQKGNGSGLGIAVCIPGAFWGQGPRWGSAAGGLGGSRTGGGDTALSTAPA